MQASECDAEVCTVGSMLCTTENEEMGRMYALKF
jgi:hypothetical protein